MRENDGFVRRETGGRKSQEKKAILLMVSLVSDASPDHVSSLMDPGYKPEIDSKKNPSTLSFARRWKDSTKRQNITIP